MMMLINGPSPTSQCVIFPPCQLAYYYDEFDDDFDNFDDDYDYFDDDYDYCDDDGADNMTLHPPHSMSSCHHVVNRIMKTMMLKMMMKIITNTMIVWWWWHWK